MFSRSQKHTSKPGILSVSAAAILWGTVGIATQTIYRQSDLTAVAVGFYRLALALPIVGFLCWRIVGKQIFQITNRQLGKMALIGVMLAIYQVCFFASISQVGVAIATLITLCSAPVLVSLISVVILGEKLTGYTLIALLAALLGTILLVGLPEETTIQNNVVLGVALALGSATGYAIVVLMGRTIAANCHPILSTTVSFGVGAIFLFPLAAGTIFTASYNFEIWELIVYVGLLPTAVAYSLFFFGMRSIKASSASILTMLEPLTATILAWIIFDEHFAPAGFIGALLLLGAMMILYQGEKSAKVQ